MHGSSPSHLLPDKPSAWVARFAPLIPPGEVLDLACGGGRHTRLLAGRGHPVLAVDRDAFALERAMGPAVTTLQVDLESDAADAWPFGADRFAGIVVTNYLHRPLFPRIFHSLAPNGVLIYETFAQGNAHFGKPANPLFLLERGELLDAVAAASRYPLRILAFEDGYVDTPKPAIVQRICVVKADAALTADRLRLI